MKQRYKLNSQMEVIKPKPEFEPTDLYCHKCGHNVFKIRMFGEDELPQYWCDHCKETRGAEYVDNAPF